MHPPYRVPTMAEISAISPNGFNVASTFAGGGGSSLGYRMAGFRVRYANEFVAAAREVYAENNPGCFIDPRDIREVCGADILPHFNDHGGLDVLDGSPPCASFSAAGKGRKAWGEVKAYSDTKQRTDDLFNEYIRLVSETRPKVFVAENVPGVTSGAAVGYFREIMKGLADLGYRVDCRIIDMQWLGVPQARRRAIFMGVREDLGCDPIYPTPLNYRYSIKDAIPWVDLPDESSPFPVEPETSIARYKIGEKWDTLGYNHKKSTSLMLLIRPTTRKPCPTITATAGCVSANSVCHPHLKRKFSIAELKRLSGYPDDFQLLGTYSKQVERLGRSVPPLAMRAVALCVEEVLRGSRTS